MFGKEPSDLIGGTITALTVIFIVALALPWLGALLLLSLLVWFFISAFII